MFGCHLLTLCEREETLVPRFVKLCVEAVEKRGMNYTVLHFYHKKILCVLVMQWLRAEECMVS